jgi:hypothetical protein
MCRHSELGSFYRRRAVDPTDADREIEEPAPDSLRRPVAAARPATDQEVSRRTQAP